RPSRESSRIRSAPRSSRPIRRPRFIWTANPRPASALELGGETARVFPACKWVAPADPWVRKPSSVGMIYLYETIPGSDGEAVNRYEIKQSIHDAPLTRHPETGEA